MDKPVEIWVAAGTYYPTSDYGLGIGDRGKHFRMINGVLIYGGFDNTGAPNMANRDPDMYKTILSGDIPGANCYHVFYHPSGTNLDTTAVLDGFTITGGNADSSGNYRSGGGMVAWSNTTVANCIFWGTAFGDEIDGEPSVVYSCIQGGYSGTGNIDSDPLFADPDGADNILGTEDDNLRLQAGSPCIDVGDSNSVSADLTDLDDDGDTTEPIPWDLDGHNRFVDDPNTADTGVGTPPIVDMGAYERGICGDADHPYPVGDMNSDCQVNVADVVIMALAWLSEDGQIQWNPACNLYNSDSIIDASDFAVMGQHWLECTKPECD